MTKLRRSSDAGNTIAPACTSCEQQSGGADGSLKQNPADFRDTIMGFRLARTLP